MKLVLEVSVTAFKHTDGFVLERDQEERHPLELEHLQMVYQVGHHWDLGVTMLLFGSLQGLKRLLGNQPGFLPIS